eukprot:7864524-Alexandrium_andersonii.AAC.1
MEPRWRAGIWLGRRWGSTVHYVWDPGDQTIHEVRAIQRRPASERWSLAEIQAATALPRVLRQGDASSVARDAVIEPAEAVADLPPPPPSGRRPNS